MGSFAREGFRAMQRVLNLCPRPSLGLIIPNVFRPGCALTLGHQTYSGNC